MIDDEQVEEVETEAKVEAEVEEAVEEAPPETYTREQLAELLGPRFERFAGHEGEEAFRQFGSAYENATGLIRQGAHLSPQDASIYESLGLDPNEIPQPEPEQAPGLFGTPWDPPSTWDEVNAYAQSDDPNARRMAAMAVMSEPRADEATKAAYFNNWAAIDPHGAAAYSQQAVIERIASERETLKAELMAELAPVQQAHVNTYVDGVIATAKAEIPGFSEHADGVQRLMKQRESQFPGYGDWFSKASPAEQLGQFRELTLIAASMQAPERQAANAAAAADSDAAKKRARTETSRNAGEPATPADELTQQRRDGFRRVGARIT